VVGTLIGLVLELPALILKSNPFKRIFNLNPSGQVLMDFCFVSLWCFEGQVSLLSGTIKEQIRFYLVKRKVKQLIQKVSSLVYYDNSFDFDLVLNAIAYENADQWERLLHYIIIKAVANWALLSSSLDEDVKLHNVLSLYLEEVNENHSVSGELLELKIERIKMHAQMDLLQASVSSKNKTGQFSPLSRNSAIGKKWTDFGNKGEHA
jgi:hypothetical protein